MKKQAGFTLIELVMVIVILGILAAVALPKFVDLSGDAKKAAVQATAGALSSGGTINYAQRSFAASGATASGVAVTSTTNCDTALATSLLQNPLPTTMSMAAGTVGVSGIGCSVQDTANTAISAVAFIPLTK